MRIGLFTDTYPPFINGVSTSVLMLKQGLEKLGHEVYVVTVNDESFSYKEEDGILKIPSFPIGLMNFRQTGIYPIKAFNIIKKWKLDIIHSHTEFSIGTFARLISKQLNIPLVHTYHTMYEEYIYYITKGYFNSASKKLVEYLTLFLCDKTIDELIVPTEKTKELFNKLGIYTKNDLIHYYPYRYEILKRTNIEEIYTTNKIIIDGHIISDALLVYLSKNLKRITFKINIGNNILNVIIYNRIYLLNELKTNKEITVIGKYDINKKAIIASDIRFEKLSDTPKIESIYHKTPGLTQKIISKSILNLLEENNNIPDYIPEYLSKKYNFISKKKAIHEVHIPSTILILKKARQRLKYEELFMYLLKINYLKEKITLWLFYQIIKVFINFFYS